MKKLFIIIPIVLMLSSCRTSDPSGRGKLARKEESGRNRIESVETKINNNTQQKLESVGEMSFAIDYQLNKITNKTEEIQLVETFNDRILTLTPSPSLQKVKELQAMVDELNSNIERERERGKKALDIKDREINLLQVQKKELDSEMKREIDKYIKLAQDAAAQGDSYKSELNKYESWFGLGAIVMGFKRLFMSAFWIIIIGGILFLLLRLLATSNPIAAAIFSIFEQMVSWVINAIKHIFPNALSIAGTVSKEAYDKMHGILTKLIDNIQTIKDIEKRTGKDATLKEVLNELAVQMDSDEKEMINKIKKDMGY